MAFGLSAGAVALIAAGTTAAASVYSANKNAKAVQATNQAQLEANQVDPRINNMLFGSGTKTLKDGVTPNWVDSYDFGTGQTSQTLSNPQSDYTSDNGLLGRYAGLLDTPQKLGMQQYGQANDNYIGAFTAHDLEAQRGVGSTLMAGDIKAPTMNAAQIGQVPGMTAARVNAPSQNSTDLSKAYGDFIYGDKGNNPYLTGAIQKGINQSSNAFGNMVSDAKQATQDVLGGIRSNSVLAGQYGGSRQGLAEGKAIESMNTQLGRAASQFGQNNTDAAVAAQAGAYDADSNRALSATQGLSGQQYGVASQNAAMQQAANQTNYGGLLSTAQNNAQLQQGANQANLQSNLSTNNQNSANMIAGSGITGGLLGQAGAAAGAQDMYDINKATNVNGLLSTYLNKNATPTQLTPVYNNSGASALGGAAAGLGMYSQFMNMNKPPTLGSGPAGTYFDGYGYMPNGQ